MSFQLHHVLEMFSTLFVLEGGLVCVFSQVLIVVSFIRVTVVTLAAFVHNSTVGAFMFYQIAFVGEVFFTERFLGICIPLFCYDKQCDGPVDF